MNVLEKNGVAAAIGIDIASLDELIAHLRIPADTCARDVEEIVTSYLDDTAANP